MATLPTKHNNNVINFMVRISLFIENDLQHPQLEEEMLLLLLLLVERGRLLLIVSGGSNLIINFIIYSIKQ